MKDLIQEVKESKKDHFKKKLDSLHHIILNLNKDLKDIEVVPADRNHVINSFYREFEREY